MALSKEARARLESAITRRSVAKEIADAIDAGGNAQAAHVASVSTANATDLASAEALANANKVAINALLAALQAAGLMA